MAAAAAPRGLPGSGVKETEQKAGNVYFQVSIMVLNGLPPVIAAAANGDSAVGGLTSESTA